VPAPAFISPLPDGLMLRLRVTPNARHEAIAGCVPDTDGSAALKVAVTAVAEDGKANQAVIALLARTWHLPRSSLSLVHGASARNKRLHLAGNPAELQARISQWWQTHAGQHDD
jgi:uncharacterized protein (TIGR00251 family)